MKRERDLEKENNNTNFTKRLDRIVDNDNKQKHTIWCLSQAQKYLYKIIKEYCPLCNRRMIKDKNQMKDNNVSKCSYCNKNTCNDSNCLLTQCNSCELLVCSLCGNYNYDSENTNSVFLCPNCS